MEPYYIRIPPGRHLIRGLVGLSYEKILGIIVLGLLLGGNAYAENLNLECYGVGSTIGSITKYDQNTGVTTGSNYKKEINSTINVSIGNKGNWIQIPNHLLPPIKKKQPNNKYNIYKLKTSEDSITGKFKLNFANKPSMTLDRYSGVLSYKGLGTSFTGECKKVDRTKKNFKEN